MASPSLGSNRGFWLVTLPMAAASLVLLTLIFLNRPVAQRASEFTARHDLRVALGAAQAIRARDGSFAAATPEAMRRQSSDLAFTDPDISSNNSEVVSVFATDALWAAAARAETGACFWIRVDAQGNEATGRGSDCTGDAASAESPTPWPSP